MNSFPINIKDKIKSVSKNDADFEEISHAIQSKFTISLDDNIISSKDINTMLLKFDLDINNLYSNYTELDGIVDKSKSINNFFYESSLNKIKELNDMIDTIEMSMSKIGSKRQYIDNLRNINSFEPKYSLYTERYGEPIMRSLKAKYNPKEESITLSNTRNDNSLNYGNKISTANISLTTQLGSGFVKVKNPNGDISNAIDTSNNTFWSETILSDEPICVSFNDTIKTEVKNINGVDKSVNVMRLNDGYYYGVNNGALCEIEINFESINVVNEISIDPYSKYPIKVVAVRYKTSDDPNEELVEIASINHIQEELQTGYISSTKTIRFNDIVAKNIYIMIVQEHYEKGTYVYNQNDLYKNEVWYMPNLNSELYDTSRIFQSNYDDRSITDIVWYNIDKITSRNKNIDVSKIILEENDVIKQTTKYEYSYGLYNVSCNNVNYNKVGVYVSNKIKTDNAINKLSIYTEEVHQISNIGQTITDIEFYITASSNPTYEDWTPILPKNKDYIYKELLQLYDGDCILRFEADTVDFVYIDEIKMQSTDYILNKNDDGLIYSITISNFDFNSIYSVSYKPNIKSKTISIGENLNTSYQSFNGNDKSFFVLDETPSISSDVVYCDIKIINKDTNKIYSQGLNNIVNVTDIENPAVSYKNIDITAPVYQYCIVGNKIIFNKEISDNCFIDITYLHYTSSIRLKAIFRRNTNDNFWLTPVLNKIKYEFDIF